MLLGFELVRFAVQQLPVVLGILNVPQKQIGESLSQTFQRLHWSLPVDEISLSDDELHDFISQVIFLSTDQSLEFEKSVQSLLDTRDFGIEFLVEREKFLRDFSQRSGDTGVSAVVVLPEFGLSQRLQKVVFLLHSVFLESLDSQLFYGLNQLHFFVQNHAIDLLFLSFGESGVVFGGLQLLLFPLLEFFIQLTDIFFGLWFESFLDLLLVFEFLLVQVVTFGLLLLLQYVLLEELDVFHFVARQKSSHYFLNVQHCHFSPLQPQL